MKKHSPGCLLIAGLVWWGCLLNLSGWILSFFHGLNQTAYRGIGVILLFSSFFFLKNQPWLRFFKKSARRFRRPLPATFAATACLVLLGALIYPPSNYDALTYRIPRVMHWLAERGWFWISTANPRQNYSGVAQEWLLAPILALTHSDRLLFLPNFICFIFFPSISFGFLRGIGASGRMAGVWMWLFPFAPAFLLQAGGMANDLLGAFFFLCSLSMLASRQGPFFFPTTSILSLGLATGVKASNLVLVLPWAVKFLWEARRRHAIWRPMLLAAPLAAMVSFAPVACLNFRHTGDWTGDPRNEYAMKSSHPVLTGVGNSVLVVASTFQQPIDFGCNSLLHKVARWIPEKVRLPFLQAYPRWSLPHGEFAIEENASWGWPLLVLLLWSAFPLNRLFRGEAWELCVVAWLSATFMMSTLASEAIPRLLSPLYPLLALPCCVHSGERPRFFRAATCLAILLLLAPLFLSPSRPLVPWSQIGRMMAWLKINSAWPTRIAQVEQAYNQRAQGLQALIPEDHKQRYLQVLLISNGNDTEGPLWWPYGQRTVESRRPEDPPPWKAPDLILIRAREWPAWSSRWEIQGQLIHQAPFALLAKTGQEDWFCMRPERWPNSP